MYKEGGDTRQADPLKASTVGSLLRDGIVSSRLSRNQYRTFTKFQQRQGLPQSSHHVGSETHTMKTFDGMDSQIGGYGRSTATNNHLLHVDMQDSIVSVKNAENAATATVRSSIDYSARKKVNFSQMSKSS